MINQDTRFLYILQKNKITRFLKIFKEKDWVKIFIFSCFLLIALILAIGTYFFSKSTFSFLRNYPELIESLSFYLLLSWFFLILILVLASSIISALRVFFEQDDDDFLLSRPINTQIIFESRFIDLLFLSCWPIVIFGIPLLLAFYQALQLSFLNFLLSLLVLLLILLVATLLASILSLKITSFTGRVGSKVINLVGLLSLPFLAWWVSAVLIPPNLVEAFEKVQLEEITQFLKSLPINSNWLPSTWAVNFIFYWQQNRLLALFNLEKMLLFLLILSVLIYWLVKKEYFDDLSRARVGRFIAGTHDITLPSFRKRTFPYLLKGIKGVFLEKDILMLIRNQAEILQGGFILFMVLLYFLLLSRIPLERAEESLPEFSLNNLIRMSFVFNAYILTLLALRFIFPSISLEGQSAWLIWSAPFSKAKLFWQKLLTGGGALSLVGGTMSFVSVLILKLDFSYFVSQFFIFLVMALTITSINLGIGTLFPNFAEKNPEKISTSTGGLLAIALSLFYIFLVGFLFFSKFKPFSLPSSLYTLLISGLLCFVFIPISLNRINKYEF